MATEPLWIAVIGHVEHVTLGRVDAVPRSGDIVHVMSPRSFPGGGGGIAFLQLARSDAEVHLFTALGDDEAATCAPASSSPSAVKRWTSASLLASWRNATPPPPPGNQRGDMTWTMSPDRGTASTRPSVTCS